MRRRARTLLALAAFGGIASIGIAGIVFADPWQDSRLSSVEKKASAELSAIQQKIAAGEIPKVQFDLDSAKIQPESTTALDLIADLLLRNPKLKLRIAAHTCSLGSEAHNLELSARRASAVKGYLVKQGVPPPSVRSKGYGSSQPIGDNSTEEGRQQNRRVEFRLVFNDWPSVF